MECAGPWRRHGDSGARTVRSGLLPGAPALGLRAPPAADNRLRTTKYSLLSFVPKNLFEQLHRLANVYFVLIALLNFAPPVSAFQPGLALAPVLFILAVTALKDLWEDLSRHRSDRAINHRACLVFGREEKTYVSRFWKEICVGDFVRLRCNEIIPADILLLSSSDPDGLCHIETANLDGETNLKRRQVVHGFSELDCFGCWGSLTVLHRFEGQPFHLARATTGMLAETALHLRIALSRSFTFLSWSTGCLFT